jgi:hypothetical protein
MNKSEISRAATTRKTENIVLTWSQAMTDSVDYNAGECLTGYEPAMHASALIEKLERMADESSPPSSTSFTVDTL